MNAVCPVSRQIRRTSSCSVPRVSASSAENGSSISMIFGVIESARAMPTRCFMPPESSDGRLCSAPVKPTRSMKVCACALTLARAQSRHFDVTAYATSPSTVRQGSSAWLWKITARSRLVPSIACPSTIDGAIARLVEACQNVQHRGLAAAGVPDYAAELAARHRQPEIFEHRDRTAVGARIAFCNALDGNELFRAHARSFHEGGGLPRSALRGERVGVRGSLDRQSW